MRIHANKKAIRALGIAESFTVNDKESTLAGVVMRADLLIDGFVFGKVTLEGNDATKRIERMYRRLHRNDVNVVMLSGCIISLYNIVDVELLAERLDTPVICLTYKESGGIEGAIRHHFPTGVEEKLRMYRKLGGREQLTLHTGHGVFVRASGLSSGELEKVLNLFTLQGAIPEPVRLARLLAKARRG